MMLGVGPNERVFRLGRLSLANGVPMAIGPRPCPLRSLPDWDGDRELALRGVVRPRPSSRARYAEAAGDPSRRIGRRALGVEPKSPALTSSASPISPTALAWNSPVPGIGPTPTTSSPNSRFRPDPSKCPPMTDLTHDVDAHRDRRSGRGASRASSKITATNTLRSRASSARLGRRSVVRSRAAARIIARSI